MGAVAELQPDQNLLLVAPFEPRPLFGVLAKQGFTHAAKPVENGDWEVLFTPGGKKLKDTDIPAPDEREARRVETAADGHLELDARGLEPPQPMVKILETIATLPDGAELRARTDRRPMHLYAQLEERGFTGQTEEQGDGSFITHIRRG